MKDAIMKIVIILSFILIVVVYIKLADFSPKNGNEELFNRIDRLELKIDSINIKKDSIRTVIDSTHVKIIENETYYKERVNTIIHQSYSTDSSFITDYIRQYSDKNSLSNIE